MHSFFLFLFLALIESQSHIGVIHHYTAPAVVELRTIIKQRCLWSPSSESMEALILDDLNVTLKNIDPYARYVPAVSLSTAPAQQSSLGIEVFSYKSEFWIRPDFKGQADRAGVPEISRLLAINHKEIAGLELAQVSTLLDLAVKKQQVDITLSNCSSVKRKSYKIHPTDSPSASLVWKRAGNFVIIRVKEFVSHDTAPKFAALYTTVVKNKLKVVIDLRGCAGGDLYEAVEIAGMFVSSGLLLATTHDRAGMKQTYRAQSGEKLPHPFLLLLDHRTASAAEVLAAILKYYKITLLVGVQSVGKCVSQEIIPLSSGGDLWLTTLEIRFPDGMTCIKGQGLDPDIVYPEVAVTKLSDIIRKVTTHQTKNKFTDLSKW